MKNLKWVLEQNFFENDQELKEEIIRQGMECKLATSLKIRTDPYSLFSCDEKVIYRGSLYLLYNVDRCGWYPGALCNRNDYNLSSYSASIGEHLLNSNYHLMSFNEIYRRKAKLAEYYKTPLLFVKADNGCNTYYKSEVVDIRYFYSHLGVDLAVVSNRKKIRREWRFYIAKNQVITGSLYKYKGGLKFKEVNKGFAFDYANFIASELPKDFVNEEIFVLDVCEHKGNLYALEINSFSCSGMYKCNVSKIVAAVKDIYSC